MRPSQYRGASRAIPDTPYARGRPHSSLKTFVDDRLGPDRHCVIVDRKICVELGYRPRRPFSEGARETLQWYLTNRASGT
jgi:dTDP-glucose 4,6-dehydratase